MSDHASTGTVAFVYGTLTDAERVAEVVDDFEFRRRAILEGCHVVDGRYPTLAPGGEAEGRLLWVADRDAVDAYEGVDRGLYVRATVPLRGGDAGDERDEVAVYVGNPERLGVDEAAAWPGEGSFEERVRAHLRDADVRVRRVD